MADLVSTLEKDHLVARVELDGRLNVLSEKLEGMKYRSNRYDLLWWRSRIPCSPTKTRSSSISS